MKEYRYVIVRNNAASFLLAGDLEHGRHKFATATGTEVHSSLPALLGEGWTPVREVGGTENDWLVLLEREKPVS